MPSRRRLLPLLLGCVLLASCGDAPDPQAAELEEVLRREHGLAEIGVAPTGEQVPPPPAQPLVGEVVQVKDEGSRGVISLGTKDGVVEGMRFAVSRGTRFLCVVRVTKVQDHVAAVKAVEGMLKVPFEVGDRVETR